MTGQSFTTVMNSGRQHAAMSKQNQRTGPSTKNLGPSRGASGQHPKSQLNGSITAPIKGPDKGAGEGGN